MRRRVGATLKMILRRTLGAAGLAFVIGAACDIALSPLVVAPLDLSGARWAPTGLAWLYLVPVLLAHGLVAALRPSMGTGGSLEALIQPPAGTLRLGWTGPLALALLGLPALAVLVHWVFAVAWVLLALAALRVLFLPATLLEGTPRPLRTALDVGLRPLPTALALALAVLAISFIVSNLVLGIVMLPISQQAGPDFQPGSGLLPLLQVNLFLALATPGLAAVIAAAWQGHRRQAWTAAANP